MTRSRPDVLQGTLDMLILQTLSAGPSHGWGVARLIQQHSEEALQINQGSLYPALYRLQDQGLVRSQVGESATGRPVKIYQLTAAGRKQLAIETELWERMSRGVNLVLEVGS